MRLIGESQREGEVGQRPSAPQDRLPGHAAARFGTEEFRRNAVDLPKMAGNRRLREPMLARPAAKGDRGVVGQPRCKFVRPIERRDPSGPGGLEQQRDRFSRVAFGQPGCFVGVRDAGEGKGRLEILRQGKIQDLGSGAREPVEMRGEAAVKDDVARPYPPAAIIPGLFVSARQDQRQIRALVTVTRDVFEARPSFALHGGRNENIHALERWRWLFLPEHRLGASERLAEMARLHIIGQNRLSMHDEIAEMMTHHFRLLELVSEGQEIVAQLLVFVLLAIVLRLLVQLVDDVAHAGGSSLFIYLRRTAPVSLAAAWTIRWASASISASVSVRSVGCNVTSTASDFMPASTPGPV